MSPAAEPGRGRVPGARAVLERCRSLGFAAAGICAARPTDHEQAVRDWLGAGRHGSMAWLAEHLDLRLDPTRLVPGARSIICVADRYADGRQDPPRGPGDGRIARYARGRDYHRTIRRRLHRLCDELREHWPEETFRTCVDTAPILEREHAQRAGLGAVGKHTLLLQRGLGSWLLLGEIVTTVDLEPSEPADPDPCGACTRCIDACPTAAITPFSVDASRCISTLTIEHRKDFDPDDGLTLDGWLFGCDVCQEVCPHGRPTGRSLAAPVHPDYAARRERLPLLEVLGWTAEDRLEALAGTAATRAKLGMLKRNAIRVAIESGAADRDPALRARIERAAGDPDEEPLVRRTAAAWLARSHRPTEGSRD